MSKMSVSPKSLFRQRNRIFTDETMKSRNSVASTTNLRKMSRLSQLRNKASFSTVRSWFVDNLSSYCNSTSLHGFNYITLKGITRIERTFWTCVVTVAISVSITLVIMSWFLNRETPTVTVIESAHYPTWNIPFPAITICNFNKISKMKSLSLAKILKRPENVTEHHLLDLFRITMFFNSVLNHTQADVQLLTSILQQNNITLKELSERITPDCMDMMSKCMWKGTSRRCDSLFQRTTAVGGACCSFNYFGLAQNNFPPKIAYQVPKRPYRATGCGYASGITVVLNPIVQDYFGTFFSSYGFRLLIHNAYDFPDENAETKVVTSSSESFVRINPESTYATKDIQNMDISVRNCLFANEQRLYTMQRYSFVNCMVECRIVEMNSRCGCLPLNLPNNGSYRSCDITDIGCVLQARNIHSRALPTVDETLSIVRDTKSSPCNCISNCEFNNYASGITMGRLNMKMISNKIYTDKTVSANDQILLHVFFSDLMATRFRMDTFQNWLSALATFGGLLGLIMGFSIVTAFEFLYFLTFRPVFDYLNET